MYLYNSLTKKIEKFSPLNKDKVLMYVCGITPYDTTHLGHAFTYVFFDVLQRYLKFRGCGVIYTQNVTDIDDDILKKATKTNQNWNKLGQYWTKRYIKDLEKLNVEMPTNFVKATDSIPRMIKIIKVLIERKFAYLKNGNVYFNINKFPRYGKLSGFNKEQMSLILNERGGNTNDPNKVHPLDFLLWQKSSEDEPSWDSPWGEGRPGWHIECSAMVDQYLAPQIDIHGGGRDLAYPHHESEIAQSESYTNKVPYVKFWMHTGMLQYQGEKMSKSLGNLVMVSNLLKKYSVNAIRWVLLSHHYRSPWEFNIDELKMAELNLARIKKVLQKPLKGKNKKTKDDSYIKRFEAYLDDDMDTPNALSILVGLSKNSDNQETLELLFTTLGFLLY